MDYSVVIPAHNAASMIGQVIDAALAMTPAPRSVIVYDDASTDGTSAEAERAGALVIRGDETRPVGPSVGRNRGAREAETEAILFVDSDVVVAEDAAEHLLAELQSDPSIAAAFGCYGAEQHTENAAARYANLRHHLMHCDGEREAETFWTGLGMVRRKVFGSLKGFDDEISRPMMEDIELGFRFRRAGYRVRLVPQAKGDHLKNWTLRQLWRDDILTRALPWSLMIAEGRGVASLNAGGAERFRAALAWIVAALLFATLASPAVFPFFVLAAFTYGISNHRFYGLMTRHGGLKTTIAGPLLHFAYHLYASAVFGTVIGMAKGRQLARVPGRKVRRALRASNISGL